jgi:hypothetical protein
MPRGSKVPGGAGRYTACVAAAALGLACGSSTHASAGAGNGADAGEAEGSVEAGAPAEGAPYDYDAGTPYDAPTGCVPGDVSGYVPAWHPPRAPQPACSDKELDDIEMACFSSIATSSSCSAFENASPVCWSCMVTPDTSVTWGPVVASTLTPFTYGNFAGCLALQTGDESSASCGAMQQAARVCTEYACSGKQCPANTRDEVAAVAVCVHDAMSAVCSQYQDPEVACVVALQAEGGAAAAAVHTCNENTYGDQPTYYRALGVIFCGMGNATGSDAGDASD